MVKDVCIKNNDHVYIAIEPVSRLNILNILSTKVLGAGAMVTYLKLRVQRLQERIKLHDEGPSALSECLHHLAGILPDKCVLGCAVRASFPFYHGILSQSFSRGVGSGGVGDGALASHAVRQLATITHYQKSVDLR